MATNPIGKGTKTISINLEPRPWYLSFTVIWHDAEGFAQLRGLIQSTLKETPFHHLPVKEELWHFTVLPLLRANEFPAGMTVEEHMRGLLQKFKNFLDIDAINSPVLNVEANKISSFDSGTTIEFGSNDKSLENLRSTLRELSLPHIAKLVNDESGLFSELDPQSRKNSGGISYGSIARAVTTESNTIRYETDLVTSIPLKFSKLYLLASDQYLSNPSAKDDAKRYTINLT